MKWIAGQWHHQLGATRRTKMRIATLTALFATMIASAAVAEPDWKAVGQTLGKEGAVMPGGVYRVGLPRTDLKVTLDGVEIKPGFALGSWLAFKPMGNDAMVMGDLVLTGDEVNPVMNRRLRAHRGRGQSRSEGAPLERHRGHGDPQPHARRRSTSVLYALLGERRSAEAREGPARRARPREGEQGGSAVEAPRSSPHVWSGPPTGSAS